jgi:hypothetical protein
VGWQLLTHKQAPRLLGQQSRQLTQPAAERHEYDVAPVPAEKQMMQERCTVLPDTVAAPCKMQRTLQSNVDKSKSQHSQQCHPHPSSLLLCGEPLSLLLQHEMTA